jgi:hypothetical protein
MNSYSLDKTDRTKEIDTIKHIAYKNKYDTTIIDTLNDHLKNRKVKAKDTHNTKWATISYIGKETNSVARLFKNKYVKIAYTTKNTILRLLTPRDTQTKDPYNNNGVYKLSCPGCNKEYVGQTGRPFRVRFSEHLHDYKYQNPKSKFALHLLENKRPIAPIHDIMEILYNTNKGRFMNTIEQYHIYRITQNNIQINDKNTVKPNAIFKTLILELPNR